MARRRWKGAKQAPEIENPKEVTQEQTPETATNKERSMNITLNLGDSRIVLDEKRLLQFISHFLSESHKSSKKRPKGISPINNFSPTRVFPVDNELRMKIGFPRFYFHDDPDLFKLIEEWTRSTSSDGAYKLPLIVDGMAKSGKTTLSRQVIPSLVATIRKKEVVLITVSLEKITRGTLEEREKKLVNELQLSCRGKIDIEFSNTTEFRVNLSKCLEEFDMEAVLVIDEVHLGFSALGYNDAAEFGRILKALAAPYPNELYHVILTGATQSLVWNALEDHIPPNGVRIAREGIPCSTSITSSPEMFSELYDELVKDNYFNESKETFDKFLSSIPPEQKSCSTVLQVLALARQRLDPIDDHEIIVRHFHMIVEQKFKVIHRDYTALFPGEDLTEVIYKLRHGPQNNWKKRIFDSKGRLKDLVLAAYITTSPIKKKFGDTNRSVGLLMVLFKFFLLVQRLVDSGAEKKSFDRSWNKPLSPLNDFLKKRNLPGSHSPAEVLITIQNTLAHNKGTFDERSKRYIKLDEEDGKDLLEFLDAMDKTFPGDPFLNEMFSWV